MGTHMWNSAPSRRGCRLSVGRSSVGFWAPVKLSELPHENPATVSSSFESVYSWNRSPAGVKVDDVDVIQSGDASTTSAKTPAGSTGVCLNELRHSNRSDRQLMWQQQTSGSLRDRDTVQVFMLSCTFLNVFKYYYIKYEVVYFWCSSICRHSGALS